MSYFSLKNGLTPVSYTHLTVDWLGWVCYLPDKLEFILSYHVLPS